MTGARRPVRGEHRVPESAMAFLQSIDLAGEDRVGRHGVAPGALADLLDQSRAALAAVKARHDDGTLLLLRLPVRRDDIGAIMGAAGRLVPGASDIVFMGTGGSSLG